MRYRRARAGGATYFFTVNLADRGSRLLVEHIEALRQAVRTVKAAHPFEIVAWVVLPEHLHAVWTLPAGDADYLHYNPIKHGYVRRVVDWPYSSFHRFVERGWLREDWGVEGVAGEFGEPQ